MWDSTLVPALRGVDDTAALAALLARVQPFAAASAQARLTFATVARRIVLEPGRAAWHAGEPATCCGFVARGIVKIVRCRSGGRSDIIGIFGPGEAIGVVAALQRIPYPADVVAASRGAEVVEIPFEEVRAVAQRETPFANALADCAACRACRMRNLTAILAAGTVETRIAALLLDLVERFGDEGEDGVVRVPLGLSRGEIAACTATCVETTIRVMSRWSKRGLVRTSFERIEIPSLGALQEIADPGLRRSGALSAASAEASASDTRGCARKRQRRVKH